MEITIIDVFASLGIVATALVAIFKVIIPFSKKIAGWVSNWEAFMEDWAGQEARPGRDRIPGVMERLNDIDGELKNNGGSSVKDAVDRIEKDVKELSVDTKGIKSRLENGDKRFDRIEKRLNNLEK
jgi:hypothetical protein